MLYDIIYLNGETLTKRPLRERVKLLESVVREQEGRVMLCERKLASSTQEVLDSLNDAIDRREEGLVVKDLESHYKPNARNGGGWIKIKPDYIDELMDSLDLLVLGGCFGSGGIVSR